MTRLRLFAPLLLAALAALPVVGDDKKDDKGKKAAPKTLGTIERHDSAFDALLDKDAKLEIVADGFKWTEGPAWDRKNGYLLFSDIPDNIVYKYKPGEKVVPFLKPSGYTGTGDHLMEPGSNGLVFDAKGRLHLCQHGDRRVARLSRDGKSFITIADRYEGKRLNSPNDAVFAKNGDLYFTDPPYGQMPKGKPWVFPNEELGFRGVYRVRNPGSTSRKLELLTKEMTFPNGIALSPDNKTLYVAQSDPKKAIWMKFPIQADGKLGKGEVFADKTDTVGKKGKTADGQPAMQLPDGMKVDVKGNLWATGPGGLLVFSPAGKHLGTIATGVNTGNCAFGEDGSVLYIMCDRAIGKIKTKTKGW